MGLENNGCNARRGEQQPSSTNGSLHAPLLCPCTGWVPSTRAHECSSTRCADLVPAGSRHIRGVYVLTFQADRIAPEGAGCAWCAPRRRARRLKWTERATSLRAIPRRRQQHRRGHRWAATVAASNETLRLLGDRTGKRPLNWADYTCAKTNLYFSYARGYAREWPRRPHGPTRTRPASTSTGLSCNRRRSAPGRRVDEAP